MLDRVPFHVADRLLQLNLVLDSYGAKSVPKYVGVSSAVAADLP